MVNEDIPAMASSGEVLESEAPEPSASGPTSSETARANPSSLLPDTNARSSRPPRSMPRKWLHRVLAMILAPLLTLGLLEASLRIIGYGYSTDFFLDGSKVESANVWVENPNFGRWVFPFGTHSPAPTSFVLPKKKASGTFRVFVLGESAALGFPDPTTSFARVLEAQLRNRLPNRPIEVINAAIVGINSHVALPIARHCLDFEPDLLVVHLGNNEAVGPFGAAGVLGSFAPNLATIRANLAIKTVRTGQLLDQLVRAFRGGAQSTKMWKGMAMFLDSKMRPDDPRLATIRGHFQANLEDLCRAGIRAGVPIVLCTIPVNLRDCPPFASQHGGDLDAETTATWEKHFQIGVSLEADGQFAAAIRSYEQAETIDDGYAELAFRKARCLAAAANNDQARLQYQRACDLDCLHFRTDSRLNQIIRDVAKTFASSGVRLADAELAFAQASAAAVPGEDLFLEHVHMTFSGNYLLGNTVFDTVTRPALGPLAQADQADVPPLTERQCAESLAHTEWDEWKSGCDLYHGQLQEPPFSFQLDHAARCQRWKDKLTALEMRLQANARRDVIAEYQRAAAGPSADWMIHLKFGDLLAESDRPAEALEQFSIALKQMHHSSSAHTKAGLQYLKLGNPEAAEKAFREAIRLEPHSLQANLGLAGALESLGNYRAVRNVYEEQIRGNPASVQARESYGRFLLRDGNLQEAKRLFTDALAIDPDNPTLYVDLGVTAYMAQSRNDAIQHLEAALRLKPDWPEIKTLLEQVRKGEQAVGNRP